MSAGAWVRRIVPSLCKEAGQQDTGRVDGASVADSGGGGGRRRGEQLLPGKGKAFRVGVWQR